MRFILVTLGLCASAAAVFASSDGGPIRPEPGLWAFEPKVESMAVTGLPAGETEALKAGALERLVPGPRRTCMSARQAEQAFSTERLSFPGFSNDSCRFERSSLTGGRVDWAGTCRSGRSHRRFSVSGSVTSRSVDLLVNLDDSVPSQGVRLQTALRIAGRRLGPCGSEAAREQ